MKTNTNVYIPIDLKRKLKAAAAEKGITMNEAITLALLNYLKNKCS
jgi:hypothetical protein